MKRILLSCLGLLIILLSFTVVTAFDPSSEGPQKLAQYMPDTAEFYAATRINDDFINEIDRIILNVSSKLPAEFGIPTMTVKDALNSSIAQSGQSWEAISAMLGNYAAFGASNVDTFNTGEGAGWFVIEITDKAAVEALLTEAIEEEVEITEQGGFTIYKPTADSSNDAFVAISSDLLIFSNDSSFQLPVASPLSNSTAFQDSLSKLPAENYSVLMYASASLIQKSSQNSGAQGMAAMGFDPSGVKSTALGFTILDGFNLIIDVSTETMYPQTVMPVSSDFVGMLPSSTDAFFMTTNFTNLFNSLMDLAAMTSTGDQPDPRQQMMQGMGMMGLDLEEDLLSWTTGHYGVFIGADLTSLMQSAMSNDMANINGDAGIVIEATDAAKAKSFVTKLDTLLQQFTQNQEDVTVTSANRNGIDVTSIIATVPNQGSDPLMVELILGATDNFVFFGTASAFDKLSSGDTLSSDADFANANQYFLENPSGVFYANAEGTVVGTIVPLALLGPAIGNVFSNIVDELSVTPTRSNVQNPDQIMQMMQAFNDIVSSISVTTSVDSDGTYRVRIALSFVG